MNGSDVFNEPNARQKIANLDLALQKARLGQGEVPPDELSRTTKILGIRELPTREGLASPSGLARVLHDLANIEMQAMELGLRTLVEFFDEEQMFLDELEKITREESRHLSLCLDALDEIGQPWGTFPVHTQLWKSVSAQDSILDRILIVHRYQEGGGLEAGGNLIKKLIGVSAKDETLRKPLVALQKCITIIFEEELAHVQFGSRWYHHFFLIAHDKLAANSEDDFVIRLNKLMPRMPVRRERLNRDLRTRAGFSAVEFSALEAVQQRPKS